MQRRVATAIVGVALVSAIGARPPLAAAQEANSAPALPVSVDRVRQALEKPQIDLTPRRPDFSVSVVDSFRDDNPFGTVRSRRAAADWQAFFTSGTGARVAGAIGLAAATASLAGNGTMSAKPLIAMDVLAVAMAVEGKVRNVLHNRKIRNVREEVGRELAEFCARQGCSLPE